MSDASFRRRTLRALGRDVFRLGLACNFGLEPAAFEGALERGFDYLFWTSMRTGGLGPSMRAALARKREAYVVATGPTVGYFEGNVRRGAESALRALGTDYIDVFHLFWVGRGSFWRPATALALARLKEEGKIRAVAISIHDRARAAEIARTGALDLLMLRYNAAHPGAERDVFPTFPSPRPSVVAYTATSWRKLLKPVRGHAAMTAPDCYRFCLSNPNVDVVLTGPSNARELDENLTALDRGPLTEAEDAAFRAFGRAVHG